jgi:hypothetical protein
MPKVDAISQGKWQQVLGQEPRQVPRKTVKKNATILKSEFKCEGEKNKKKLTSEFFLNIIDFTTKKNPNFSKPKKSKCCLMWKNRSPHTITSPSQKCSPHPLYAQI